MAEFKIERLVLKEPKSALRRVKKHKKLKEEKRLTKMSKHQWSKFLLKKLFSI